MNLKTIIDKITDGTKMILGVPTLLFANKEEALIEARHVVSDFDQGRPDLIAAKYYGDPTALDIILKYNGISDPLSIVEGETIIIPVRDIPLIKYKRPKEVEENIVKQQFIDTKRLNQKDQKRIKALQKKYNKENLLPPNVIQVGKKTYKISNGNITFGNQAQSDPVADRITKEITQAAKRNNITKNSPNNKS